MAEKERFDLLVQKLRGLNSELSWVEFKQDNYDPYMIGKDISALANGAALEKRDLAYFVWGIDDKTHSVVGTKYDLQSLKKGNEELENWLRGLLSSNADFEFSSGLVEGKRVAVITIKKASNNPVAFEKIEYVRVGSYTKKLMDEPALQSRLWLNLHSSSFEEVVAMENLTMSDILTYLDCGAYFDLIGRQQPLDTKGVVHYLLQEKILIEQDNGLYGITNMGAILFAKKLSVFSTLYRKSIRLVKYAGNNRQNMLTDGEFDKGYVIVFEELMTYIEALVTTQENIVGAVREKKLAYPMLAIREIIANALIHQDFLANGTGPVIELFDARIEFTNSGVPLVDVNRFVDNPSRSRNERLADMMRRLKLCEELGTGWDKIVISCEMNQIPAPKVSIYEDSIRIVLNSQVAFSDLTLEDKIWSCYLHSCIKYVQQQQLSNASLRERFGLPETSAGSISRLIKAVMKKGLIKPFDVNTSNKFKRYIPFWA